ncbi:hypothetical protein GYMLUDRAFT_707624 [Collybiopsis luxurians FD-317 M1]|nr:hypothetical protein GYMLUDRAFT_707624 [Collybiopsis luxurians FD-317 M1]
MSTMSTESPKSSKSASSSNDSDNNDFSDDYSSSDDDSPWQIKENMLRTEFEWTKVVHESEGVPTHMWTFGNPSNTSVHKGKGKSMPKKVEEPSRLMVRQEFHDALVAILKWLGAKKGERNRIPFEATSTLATPSDEYPNPFREFQLKGRERLVIAGLPGIALYAMCCYSGLL